VYQSLTHLSFFPRQHAPLFHMFYNIQMQLTLHFTNYLSLVTTESKYWKCFETSGLNPNGSMLNVAEHLLSSTCYEYALRS